MSTHIYLYKKCSTCQNALRFLEKMKIPLSIKDIDQTPPTLHELRIMLEYQNGEVKKLFNTSGLLYKELGLSQKLVTMSLNDALTLLSKNGMLVKRPFLLGKNFGLLGFKEEIWKKCLK